jgi:hypothetical protein
VSVVAFAFALSRLSAENAWETSTGDDVIFMWSLRDAVMLWCCDAPSKSCKRGLLVIACLLSVAAIVFVGGGALVFWIPRLLYTTNEDGSLTHPRGHLGVIHYTRVH